MVIKVKPPIKTLNKIKSDVEKPLLKKDFVQEAKNHIPLNRIGDIENRHQEFPWENPLVRDDVTKLFNLRLSEPDWLKLKYIADKTNQSMHTLCLDILIPFIQKKLKKILEDNQSE